MNAPRYRQTARLLRELAEWLETRGLDQPEELCGQILGAASVILSDCGMTQQDGLEALQRIWPDDEKPN